MSVRIYRRQYDQAIQGATAEGLQRAGIFYHTACKLKVNKSNPGKRMTRTRDTSAGKKGSSYTVYPNPSRPGEPPRARTGFGRESIVYEYNDNPKDPRVRVGVTKAGLYMFLLDIGTRFIGARPWLVRVLKENWKKISMLAAIGGKGRIP